MKRSLRVVIGLSAIVVSALSVDRNVNAAPPHDTYGSSLGAPIAELNGLAATATSLLDVNPMNGAPTSTIPFELPLARGAAQPSLSLHYFPNEDGEVGRGWTLQMPTIDRKPLWGLPHYASDPLPADPVTKDTDRFTFAGQPLVPICKIANGICMPAAPAPALLEPFGAALEGWHYFRLGVDSSFARFFWSPDLRTWRVQDPSGIVAEYGVPTTEPTYVEGVDAQLGFAPFRWNLVRQWDAQGKTANPIIYRWAHLGLLGRGYLTDIFDTGPGSSDRALDDFSTYAHHTKLHYQQQPYEVHNGGNPIFGQHDMRLHRVDVTSKDWQGTQARSLVRSYRLHYFNEDGSAGFFNASYLTSVVHFAAVPTCLEDANFSVTPATCGARALPPFTIGYEGINVGARCGGAAYGGIPDASQFVISKTPTSLNWPPPNADHNLTIIDANQDGVADMYLPALANTPPMAITNHMPPAKSYLGVAPSGVTGQITDQQLLSGNDFSVIGDWGFDGAQVLSGFCSPSSTQPCTETQTNSFLLFESPPSATPNPFQWNQVGLFQTPVPTGQAFADINHDGLIDEFQLQSATGGCSAYISTRNADTGRVAPFSIPLACAAQPLAALADMDGDGLPDQIPIDGGHLNKIGPQQYSLQFTYSPGDGSGGFATFTPPRTMSAQFAMDHPANSIEQPVVQFHDLNGDGLADVLVFGVFDHTEGVAVFFNKDGVHLYGVTPNRVAATALLGKVRKAYYGDVDGDGLDDLVMFDGSDLSWTSKQRCGRLLSVSNGNGATATAHYDKTVRLQQDGLMKGSVPVPFDVVVGIDVNVPGAPAENTTRAYFYDNPVYDYWKHQFRGFKNVRVRTAANETFADAQKKVPAAVHHTQVATQYEITGCSAVDDIADKCNPDRDALRQLPELPIQVDVFGDDTSQPSLTDPPPASSTYHSTTVTRYSYNDYITGIDGRTVRLLTPQRVDTYLYDNAPFLSQPSQVKNVTDVSCGTIVAGVPGTNASPCSTTTVTLASPNYAHLRRDRTADNFGNLVRDIDYGRIHDDDTQIDPPIDIQYEPQQVGLSDDFWIWRRHSTHITGFGTVDLEPDHDRSFHYTWDPRGNLTQVTGTLVGTLPLARFHENGGAFASPPTTQSQDGEIDLADLTYDSKGNVVRATGPNAHCTDYAYDIPYKQLPTATTVYSGGCGVGAVVTSQTFTRQFAVPNMAMDAAGAMATVDYDDLGRPSQAKQPDPTTGMVQGAPSVSIQYSDAQNGSFHWVHVTGPGSERYVYLDALDNTAFVLDRADPSAGDTAPWIASGYQVINNAQDTLSYQAQPFSGGPDLIVSAQQIISTTSRRVAHDSYGRALAAFEFDGTQVGRMAYHALSFDRFSEQGNQSTIEHDGHGRVTTTHRLTGNDDLQLAFEYSVTGETVAATQTHGANTTERIVRRFERDSFGRVVRNIEPNTGEFSPRQTRYAYDDAGDVVGTNDARGCGENLTYDSAGRLLAEDYSPCLDSQPVYTTPTPNGFGTEAFYIYDDFGRLAATFDRGAVDAFSYDGRGRTTALRRRIAKPGDPSFSLVDRYTSHIFSIDSMFDDANRTTSTSTGADVPELLSGGDSRVHFNYSARNVLKSVDGSYGSLLSGMFYEIDGLPTQTNFADAAQTATSYFYDARRRPSSTITKRTPVNCPSSTWGCTNGSYAPPATSPSTLQSTLDDSVFEYDGDGNLRVVDDLRSPDEWPDGAKPSKRTMYYDPVGRLNRIDHNYYPSNDSSASNQVAPFAAEQQAADAAPMPSQNLPARVKQQFFNYDWRDNVTSTTDDASAFFDRSLGTTQFTGVGPHQMTGATGSGANSLKAQYDDGGNLVNLVVTRDTSVCSSPTGCAQRFVYDWDEVGNLRRARRWDYATIPGTDPLYPNVPADVPAADLSFAYHQGVRVLKTSTDVSGINTFTVNVFESLRLDHTTYDSISNDYLRIYHESAYLAGVAHLVYQAGDPSTSSDGHQYVLYETGDTVGSTSTVFDRETSEVVERITNQAYGATDSDYRPDRWLNFREQQRLSAHDDDIEVGLVYFGARYYSPNLQQWMSPDPLTIHALASDFNPYTYVGHSPLQTVDLFGLQPGCDNLSPGCNPGGSSGGNNDPTLGGGGGGGGGGGNGGCSAYSANCGPLGPGTPHSSGGPFVNENLHSPQPTPPPPPATAGTSNSQAPSGVWSFFGGYARGFVRGGASTVFSGLSTGLVPVTSIGGSILGHLLVQSGAIPGRSACGSWSCQQAYGAANAFRAIQMAVASPAPNASPAAKTGDTIGAIHGVISGVVGVTAASAGIGDLFIGGEAVASAGVSSSSGPIPRVFWTGGNSAMDAAAQFASRTGGTTLEMTEEYRAVEAATKGLDFEQQEPIWRAASTQFAEGAQGTADVFLSGIRRAGGFWETTERPILQQNNVVLRYHLVVIH